MVTLEQRRVQNMLVIVSVNAYTVPHRPIYDLIYRCMMLVPIFLEVMPN